MKTGIIATMIATTFFASCTVKLNVKKDSKSSALNSQTSGTPVNAVDSKDFLKQIDGLKTTAADIIIKEFAQHDYIGQFRNSVRSYRTFLIEKSQKQVVITDDFYSDSSKDCRPSGLSLNADDHNEMLGMILKTVILAKLSEADVSKINTGLSKELQAVTQVITMELGVDIVGTSTVSKENNVTTTKGNVTLKLKPIDGEKIDNKTKHDDEVQILTLNFERSVGDDMLGSFVSTMNLAYENESQLADATGSITVSRVKDGSNHAHDVMMSVGTKGETPSYTREIIVTDDSTDQNKFKFVDILNVGTSNERKFQSNIDLKAGTQCKVALEPDTAKGKPVETPTTTTTVVPPTKTTTAPATPTQSPNQTPVQGVIKGNSTPTQMKS